MTVTNEDSREPDESPAVALLAGAMGELPREVTHGLSRDQLQSLALQLDMALSLRSIEDVLGRIEQLLVMRPDQVRI